jgi:hypothetical protein
MLINYIQTAKFPDRTHEKGYWSNPANIQWDETIEFSLGLKSRDRSRYSIIIDFDDFAVIKNSMNGERNFASLLGYFQEHYGSQINDYLRRTNHLVSVQSAPTAN